MLKLDELDTLAATKIMRWVSKAHPELGRPIWYKEGTPQLLQEPRRGEHLSDSWRPTRCVAQAFQVLDKYRMYEPDISWSDEQHVWSVNFHKHPTIGCSSANVAKAIIVACLKLSEYIPESALVEET